SLTFKQGRISYAQMEQLAKTFAADANGVLKVVVIHHPLAPPEGSPGLDRVGRWRPALAALRQAGVHLVLSGHHHRGFSGELEIPGPVPAAGAGALLVVHAGTAVSTRTRGEEPNSYNLIRCEGARRVTVAVQVWNGSRFAEAPPRAFELRRGRWRAAAA